MIFLFWHVAYDKDANVCCSFQTLTLRYRVFTISYHASLGTQKVFIEKFQYNIDIIE